MWSRKLEKYNNRNHFKSHPSRVKTANSITQNEIQSNSNKSNSKRHWSRYAIEMLINQQTNQKRSIRRALERR
jgi:hypothetical protein